jgi:hypothetical protein
MSSGRFSAVPFLGVHVGASGDRGSRSGAGGVGPMMIPAKAPAFLCSGKGGTEGSSADTTGNRVPGLIQVGHAIRTLYK